MLKQDFQPTKILCIKDKYKKFKPDIKIEAWKYWEIVDILRSAGVEREEAYTAAKWAADNRSTGKYSDVAGMILSIE